MYKKPALTNGDAEEEIRRFVVRGTGHIFEHSDDGHDDDFGVYIGNALNRLLVCHVYEVK